MKKLKILVINFVVCLWSSSVLANHQLPFKYEMSWKLSHYMRNEVYLLDRTDRFDENDCIKEANGVQGEYDYKCQSRFLVLNNEVRENLLVEYEMISIDGVLEIFIRNVFREL